MEFCRPGMEPVLGSVLSGDTVGSKNRFFSGSICLVFARGFVVCLLVCGLVQLILYTR